jgi:hypothetical protein
MGGHRPGQFATLPRDRWLEILSRCVSPEIEPPVRRKSRRYGVESGVVRLLYQDEGVPVERTAPLREISTDGLMVKSHRRMQVGTAVWMTVTLENATFALVGRVAHSTQTVGGYKIGIRLTFPEDE